jgi:hypothetical protein
MNEFSVLLQEIIDSGDREYPALNMVTWFCGSCCCACGDVAIARGAIDKVAEAINFSSSLEIACSKIFGNGSLAESVFYSSACGRKESYSLSSSITLKELAHPHLNIDHESRDILHDYVRLVMRLSEERTS